MEERYAQAEAMAICKALYDKKAQDIRAMYVQDKTVVADWFILCSGRSVPQVKTLCDDLEEKWLKPAILYAARKGIRRAVGSFWTLEMFWYMYFIRKSALIIIWSAFGTVETT